MVYKIIWSPRALEDLKEIARYIRRDKPEVARRFGHKLIEKAQTLWIGGHARLRLEVQKAYEFRLTSSGHKKPSFAKGDHGRQLFRFQLPALLVLEARICT